VAIAIPHSDPGKVIKSGIVITIFSPPVKFCIMGSNDADELDVPVVLMLALKDIKQQTAFIRDLLALIQSNTINSDIYFAKTTQEVLNVIHKASNNFYLPHANILKTQNAIPKFVLYYINYIYCTCKINLLGMNLAAG